MWNHINSSSSRSSSGTSSNLPQRISKSAPCSPLKPKRPPRSDSFHVLHKVPVGDSPYVKAKHVQLVDKEPDKAIALFWAAINAGDRVDSALKDMAIVMKQQNRPEEAIEAIKSLRSRCSEQAQESLDNVLLDLYKRCGRLDDQIALLKHKLQLIYAGLAFNGKRTKTARSQGKKFQVSVEQEATRLLGNLGWAYMQQSDYIAAEAVYRRALSMEPDNNKMCNLGICLMKQGRVEEARVLLEKVTPATGDARWGADSHLKSYERAQEMLRESRKPAQQSMLSSYDSWEYDDEEEDCCFGASDESDENANVNIIHPRQQQQDQALQGLNSEALRKKLEMLCFNNNSGGGNKISPSKPPRPSAVRRSLSLESSAFDKLGPVLQQQQQQQQHPVPMPNPSPVKKQLFMSDQFAQFLPSATNLGGELGFIQSPKGLEMNPKDPTPQQQQQLQQLSALQSSRRLRVFQDITTSATTSPLAR